MTAEQNVLMGKDGAAPSARCRAGHRTIAIDDFAKVDLRVGQVLSAER